MKRAIEALGEENRALSRRVLTLEAEKARRDSGPQRAAPLAQPQVSSPPTAAQLKELTQLKQRVASMTQEQVRTPPTPAELEELERLKQRVEELETSKIAQEDAIRSIIRESFAKTGSKINQAVTLGGVIEMAAGRTRDFSGKRQSTIELTTAELDLDIQANDWSTARMVIGYDRGTNVVFPTTTGSQTTIDRINLDQAFVTIGDVQRFPPFVKAGRMVLPFGISTGSAFADTLSTENPLTVEAFEIRKTAVGFGIAFPTPALKPATPPVVAPPVRPMVLNPLIYSASRQLGYDPPAVRPKPLEPIVLTPAPPLFDADVFFYSGNTTKSIDGRSSPGKHYNAHVGFHTKGSCGRPYAELRASSLCPRSLDIDLSYNSSLFDSRFLENEYQAYLNQIGFVRGGAASVKSSLGPIVFVAEWNGALKQARFVDDLGNRVNIKPSAWAVSLGYQFDWNPWVQAIGEQGTYVSVGYSQSRDLQGVTQLINGAPTRVGFVPKQRVILTGGEWVADGLRVALEYSYNWDYERSVGGTGNTSHGLFLTLLYVH